MKVRFPADRDLREAIRKGVIRREPVIQFQGAKAARLDAVPDLEVLRIAMENGRALVSHDVSSMPVYFERFVAQGNRSPGLFLIPQGTATRDAVESLLLIWLASEANEWENTMTWLPFSQ